MIAKLIVHGHNREAAREDLVDALSDAVIWPVRTNAGFLVEALEHHAFASGEVDTGLIAREGEALLPPSRPSDEALAAGAAALAGPAFLPGFRLNAAPRRAATFLLDGAPIALDFSEEPEADEAVETQVLISEGGQTFALAPFRASGSAGGAGGDGAIVAPMPGRVIAVDVRAGDAVRKGQKLLTLEAMKMEHALTAPFDGMVAELIVGAGDQVQVEALLARIAAE